jgi:hypothetical protein
MISTSLYEVTGQESRKWRVLRRNDGVDSNAVTSLDKEDRLEIDME